MAKANFKGALGVEKIKNFGGICHGGIVKENGSFNAYDICNFRIFPDGTLEKREGVSPMMTLPGTARAFWCGSLDGDEMAFALIGSAVYTFDLERGKSELIGTVQTSEGAAELFFYRGTLYLVDGYDFYRYDGDEFTSFSGYVPLLGRGLDGLNRYDIYEPVNYLSDRIRVNYKLTQSLVKLYIGIACTEILSFKCNGSNKLSSVRLSEDGKYILSYESFHEKSEINVCLMLSQPERRRSELLGVTRATVCGNGDDGRIILYGGEKRSIAYVSREVTAASYLESSASDISSTDLYFPVSDTISVTDGRYPISSVCRLRDSLLIFTERETWRASFSKGNVGPRLEIADRNEGCISESGSVLCGNIPYAVSHNGICRFNDEGIAECISGEISDMLDESFFAHAIAFYDNGRGEVLFADPDSEEQDVFIYSVPGEKWYRFDGIPVDSFFSYRGKICMLYGKYIMAFSEEALVDTSVEGVFQSNIEAYYESNLTDFGFPEREKHIGRVLLKADCGGDPMYITLMGDNGVSRTVEIKDSGDGNGKYPTRFGARSGIGRFCEMNYLLRAGGEARTRVLGLTLSVLK